MSEETKAIFTIFFRDYWATEEQREAIIKREKQELMQDRLTQYEKLLQEENDD